MVRTGAIFNSLTYGGINSADYGIYISGEGVYNAPERAVELVSVPGRNGAIAIDQGHWENIEVTYPAGVFGSDKTDFAAAISSFRNAILSQKGYQRLEDTYHPDEYREGLYISGLEVDPVRMTTAGEFDLVFNCKPQRFLTVGETKTTITSGDEINNPTQYDASPIVEVTGYGTIDISGKEIELTNETMGNVVLVNNFSASSDKILNNSVSVPLGANTVSNASDIITIKCNLQYEIDCGTGVVLSNGSVYSQPQSGTASISLDAVNPEKAILSITGATATFTRGGTSSVPRTAVFDVSGTVNGTAMTDRITLTFSIGHNASSDTATMSVTFSDVNGALVQRVQILYNLNASIESTKSVLGTPTYIDCDLGECFKIDGGAIVDLNRYIDLGSDLPKLAPGANEITFDNTVTKLEIVPRWWIL